MKCRDVPLHGLLVDVSASRVGIIMTLSDNGHWPDALPISLEVCLCEGGQQRHHYYISFVHRSVCICVCPVCDTVGTINQV